VPTYVYRIIKPAGKLGATLEVQQSMGDPPLTRHPTTGQPVVRVPQAPMLQRPSASHGRHASGSCCPGCK